jgi:hypothetical protein
MATLSRPFGAPLCRLQDPTSGRGDVHALSAGQNDSPRPLAGEGMGERATCTPRFSLDSLSVPRRQEFSAFASPHPSFPRRRESSKNIGFSHEGDDVPPFHDNAKILDSRLRGNDGVSSVFVISSSARPVTGRRLRPLQGILGGKGFLQMAMTLDCPVGAATCRPFLL